MSHPIKRQPVSSTSSQSIALVSAFGECRFNIPIEYACLSPTIRNMLGTSHFREALEGQIEFPTIRGPVLEQVIIYLDATMNKKRFTPSWTSPPALVELMMAAHYLELPKLLSSVSRNLARNFTAVESLDVLPDGLLTPVLHRLNAYQLLRAEQMCRRGTRRDLDVQQAWRRMFVEIFRHPAPDSTLARRLCIQYYLERAANRYAPHAPQQPAQLAVAGSGLSPTSQRMAQAQTAVSEAADSSAAQTHGATTISRTTLRNVISAMATEVRSIRLSSGLLDDKLLSELVCSCRRATDLDLSGISLATSSGVALARALRGLRPLTCLELAHANITQEGLRALAAALVPGSYSAGVKDLAVAARTSRQQQQQQQQQQQMAVDIESLPKLSLHRAFGGGVSLHSSRSSSRADPLVCPGPIPAAPNTSGVGVGGTSTPRCYTAVIPPSPPSDEQTRRTLTGQPASAGSLGGVDRSLQTQHQPPPPTTAPHSQEHRFRVFVPGLSLPPTTATTTIRQKRGQVRPLQEISSARLSLHSGVRAKDLGMLSARLAPALQSARDTTMFPANPLERRGFKSSPNTPAGSLAGTAILGATVIVDDQTGKDPRDQVLADEPIGLRLKLSDNAIGDVTLIALANTLSTQLAGQYLRVLDLSRNILGSRAAHTVSDFLRKYPNLTALRLASCQLTTKGVNYIAEAIKQHTGLILVDLSRNSVSGASDHAGAAEELVFALRDNRSVTSWYLGGNDWRASHWQRLVQSAMTNTILYELDLARTHFPEDGGQAWIPLLARHPTLQILDMSECAISPTVMGAFASQLRENKALTTLRLDGNLWDPEAANQLGSAIATHPTLAELHAIGTKEGPWMTAEGGVALARGISRNTSLKKLHLDQQMLGGNGCFSLANALQQATSIREVSLTHNRISTRGAIAMAGELHRLAVTVFPPTPPLPPQGIHRSGFQPPAATPSLTPLAESGWQLVLDLRDNPLGPKGEEALLMASFQTPPQRNTLVPFTRQSCSAWLAQVAQRSVSSDKRPRALHVQVGVSEPG